MMKIYVVGVEDRHCDVTVETFLNKDAAISHAKAIVAEYTDTPEENTGVESPWLYCCHYSCEGDMVWVVETEVIE